MRYEECSDDIQLLVGNIITEEFPALESANVMIVMDTKKKVAGGRIVIARIKKMNDELKYFTMNDMGIMYDYVMFIDKIIFNELGMHDKERVIYHELCHCDVDGDKNNPYGIKDHEIQGFYDETSYNSDDARWSERVSLIAESVYDDA